MPTSTLPKRNSAADACTKLTLWRATRLAAERWTVGRTIREDSARSPNAVSKELL